MGMKIGVVNTNKQFSRVLLNSAVLFVGFYHIRQIHKSHKSGPRTGGVDVGVWVQTFSLTGC